MRTIPLFPELRAELEALWDVVPEGESPYAIARNRNPNTLRKRIERAVFYASLPHWERPIQNMRSSRANEIFREFGQIAEREQIGHSTATAQGRYLHIPERNTTAPPERARRLRPKNRTRDQRRPPKKRTRARWQPLFGKTKEVAKSVALLKKNKGK